MVDNLFSNKQFKLFLMLRNQKFAANANIFGKVVEEIIFRGQRMGLVVCMWEKAVKNGGISFSHLAGSREYDLGGSKNATVSKKGECKPKKN